MRRLADWYARRSLGQVEVTGEVEVADRGAHGVRATLGAVLALSSSALLIAWGTGSWAAASNQASPLAVPAASGVAQVGTPLAAWCTLQPGDAQRVLRAAMGAPAQAGAPGRGRELYLNVTPQPVLSFVVATVPMDRSDGYAEWRRGGYLLEDTYTASGAIARMSSWPIDVRSIGTLGCPPDRGARFGDVTVPDVVGQTMSQAEAELHASNLTPSLAPISDVWLRSIAVRAQRPPAGARVLPGSPVRIDPLQRGVLSFVGGGLTLTLARGSPSLRVSREAAVSIYRRHSPGPQGAPTAVLLGSVTSHAGAGPMMRHRLVWVVEYLHARIPLYGPPGSPPSAIGTWIGVVDAHTGQYLTTQNVGST